MAHLLSKSTYLRGLRCHKSLYLNKYHRDLRDEADAGRQVIFERGTEVGKLAQDLFPGGVDASPPTPYDFEQSVKLTKKFIAEGKTIIYEAAFQFEGVLCALDILVKKKGKWYAYEVKSSNNIHDYYYDDLAVQYFIITGSGLKLADIFLVHLNRNYKREQDLNIKKLFKKDSLLKEVKKSQSSVKNNISRFKEVLRKNAAPEMDIGFQCSDPFDCDFLGNCWKHVPEQSVFTISRLSGKRKFALYYGGVSHLKDVPDDCTLSSKQRIQVDTYKSKETIINKPKIRQFLKTLRWPLYFFDFETISPAVPLFHNSGPYQKIAFQYSLHYKQNRNSEVKHSCYLGESDISQDPRESLIKKFLSSTETPGDILVYNRSFEKTVLKELARDFPGYRKQIYKRIKRLVDLMAPFQQMLYYTPEMNGSSSLKAVLPAVVKNLSYDDLDIKEGGAASEIFESLYYEENDKEITKWRERLLKYCERDTFAMVSILDKLFQLTN